ncbi:unnamed protein product [Didymodactylos carnosus]|uniref:tRNA (guanine(10)-N(2))-methyltransferase TRMT11 n=1 Tax=Didymodactylos carnosus TaxID=1234261 RepID=A0A814GVE3_9BILA|nr:unnamed protein product [Didymodactylos carnosus]CAF1001266.1 unnamed protein product [Didymodactylos carnosus]CAF3602562.1 unnamed protein product [Didymodactylos carnosus]CAF3772686.1 unnamed protein product [Didymodactylos carnosus]
MIKILPATSDSNLRFQHLDKRNIFSNTKNTELLPLSTVDGKQFMIPNGNDYETKLESLLEYVKQTLIVERPHSEVVIRAAGFTYVRNSDDSVRCSDCKFEIADLTKLISPFEEHKRQRPSCPFVRGITSIDELNEIKSNPSTLRVGLKPKILQKTDTSTCVIDATTQESINKGKKQQEEEQHPISSTTISRDFAEVETIRHVRKRTYSHWPHRIPSRNQMVEAGFFNCNVGDRVICIYCHAICQQWTHNDDPIEIHKVLSPHCPYVKSVIRENTSANNIQIVNETSRLASQTVSVSGTSGPTNNNNNNDVWRRDEIVLTAAWNIAYTEIPKRYATFATWPNEPLPPVDDLVKSGFYYTGTKAIVTCFYCNGSLQNWGQNDNPMIEHARWFPHCAYARQLCGDDLYRRIQESKQASQERARTNEQQQSSVSLREVFTSNNDENLNNTNHSSTISSLPNNRQLAITDANTLSRLVAARLDLSVSQTLLSKNFKLSVIKRCYEDQLRLKHDDFASDCDLLLACTILQKQIDHIDGKKENIIVPSVHMKKLREQAEKKGRERGQAEPTACLLNSSATILSSTSSSSTTDDADMTSLTNESCASTCSTSSMESNVSKTKDETPKPKQQQNQQQSVVSNACILCILKRRKITMPRYLLYFAHELVDFRLAELFSLAEMFGFRDTMSIDRVPEEDPFLLCSFQKTDHVRQYSSRSVLLKSAYEYWANASSLYDMIDNLKPLSDCRPLPSDTFRVQIHVFKRQLTQLEKIERIEAFTDSLKMTNKFCLSDKADCTIGLFESYEHGHKQPKQVFCGKWLCNGARDLAEKFDVKKRYFIGNTTMNPTLAFIMANFAQCQPAQLVLDPFVGTGGILLSCAQFGSHVIGSELDWKTLTAKGISSRVGAGRRKADEMMYQNFLNYQIADRFIGAVGADFAFSPWRKDFKFDAIVTDPPYGIRESAQRISGAKDEVNDETLVDGHVQRKTKYNLTTIYEDLLNFANNYLRLNGRLVFWMPTHVATYDESLIPEHPSFKLVTNCEQVLHLSVSRRLLTMIKVRESSENEKAHVNERLFNSFRELYFTPYDKIWQQMNSNTTLKENVNE